MGDGVVAVWYSGKAQSTLKPTEASFTYPMKLEQLGSEYNAVTNERREESSPAVRENEIQHGHGGEHQVDDARELDSRWDRVRWRGA